MPSFIIDIEKRMTNIQTFIVEADEIWAAQEKAMELAIAYDWPEPDHEEMTIMYINTEKEHWNGIPE